MVIGAQVAVVLVGFVLANPVWACSICRCGDATFNALGVDGVSLSGLRVALDWDELEKSQGTLSAGGVEGEVSEIRERRSTLLVAYGFPEGSEFLERVGVFARVPYGERDLVENEVHEDGELHRHEMHARGWADPEFYSQLRLWSSAFEGDVGLRTSVFAVVGVKTNWGVNDASRGGERLDEHVQPGTGSTDWFGGLSASYQVDARSAVFVSAQYRHTGRNDFGYRYGRVNLFNVAYERKLSARWDAVLEANFRYSGRDEVAASGMVDRDTGGSIVYLTPRVLFDAGGGWVARAAVQVPMSQSGLNGEQEEEVVVNVGVTRAFGG